MVLGLPKQNRREKGERKNVTDSDVADETVKEIRVVTFFSE